MKGGYLEYCRCQPPHSGKGGTVMLHESYLEPGVWEIARIEVHASCRKHGVAGRLMRKVLADADEEEIPLVLLVGPEDEADVPWLMQWYGCLGFESEVGAAQEMHGRLMRRLPLSSRQIVA